MEPRSPALQADSLPTELSGKHWSEEDTEVDYEGPEVVARTVFPKVFFLKSCYSKCGPHNVLEMLTFRPHSWPIEPKSLKRAIVYGYMHKLN